MIDIISFHSVKIPFLFLICINFTAKYEIIFFLLKLVPANKMELFFVHSTTGNAPYVHPRLDSILELCLTFPIVINLFPVFSVQQVIEESSNSDLLFHFKERQILFQKYALVIIPIHRSSI